MLCDTLNRKPVWEKDHDLKAVFVNSIVWYSQQLKGLLAKNK